MTRPKLLALHTGVPAPCYTQEDIATALTGWLNLPGTRREKAVRAVMNKSGVLFRHAVIEPEYFAAPKTTAQRNERYMAEALPLGARVIEDGLRLAGVTPDQIDSLFIVSCTGFNTPGLDLLLARQLGMRTSLSRTNILGMGCYGAFPGLKRAWERVSAGENRLALVLALELCTLHLQLDESVDSIVSTSLFADGAAMALVGQGSAENAPALVDSETYCDYQTLDHMTFNVTDNGFRMTLSSYVPDVLAANVSGFVERLLARNHLAVGDVKFWAIYPGSQRIVEYIQERLGLADEQVLCSLDTLRENGNMSSATVLFVLDRIAREQQPQPGDYGVMMAFGPGLTMESILLRW